MACAVPSPAETMLTRWPLSPGIARGTVGSVGDSAEMAQVAARCSRSRTGQQLVQYSVAAVTGHRWPEMFNEGVRPDPHRSGTHTTSTCGSDIFGAPVATRGGGRGGVAVPDRDAAGSERDRSRKITSRCGCSMTRTRVRIRIWIWLFGRQSI